MFPLKEIEKVVQEKKPTGRGTECVFIPINEKWGIKLYQSKRARNFAHGMQIEAEINGVGPPAGAIFQLSFGTKRYGYLTRIANTDLESLDLEEQYFNLVDKMEEIGMSTIDMDLGANVGLFEGRLVCIDFGPYSMGYDG